MDYSILFYIVITILLAGVIFLLLRKKPETKKDDGSLLLLQQQINQIAQAVDTKLSESNKNVQDQFRHSADIIKNVTEQLTKLDATSKQVVGFADQLQKLQSTLTNPKHRGNLGEYFLDSILKDVFQPNQYQLQYQFKNGDKVDAAIFFGEKIIPLSAMK